LWREFEDRETPEAKFAGGLDRLCPLLQNLHHRGNLWRERGIKYEQAHTINSVIGAGSSFLWNYASRLLNEARDAGYFSERWRWH